MDGADRAVVLERIRERRKRSIRGGLDRIAVKWGSGAGACRVIGPAPEHRLAVAKEDEQVAGPVEVGVGD